MFLCKTLNSHNASLHPGVQIGTSKFNAGGNPVMNYHPIYGEGGGGRNTPSDFMLQKPG